MTFQIILIGVMVLFLGFVVYKLVKKNKVENNNPIFPPPVEPICSKPTILSVDDLGDGTVAIDFAYDYCEPESAIIEFSEDTINWESSEIGSYFAPRVVQLPSYQSRPILVRIKLQCVNGLTSEPSDIFYFN